MIWYATERIVPNSAGCISYYVLILFSESIWRNWTS